MNKEFVPYEISIELKELGFDEPCFTYYKNDQLSDVLELVKNSEMENVNNEVDDYISAPTFSQAFRWFRETHNYYISVFRTYDGNWGIDLWLLGVHKPKATIFGETYEEAEFACLNKLIELVKINSYE
jgi:hypothetical protein